MVKADSRRWISRAENAAAKAATVLREAGEPRSALVADQCARLLAGLLEGRTPGDWLDAFTVHVLRAGRALCSGKNRILRRVPGNWPGGHVWTRDPQNATCKDCLARATAASVGLAPERPE